MIRKKTTPLQNETGATDMEEPDFLELPEELSSIISEEVLRFVDKNGSHEGLSYSLRYQNAPIWLIRSDSDGYCRAIQISANLDEGCAYLIIAPDLTLFLSDIETYVTDDDDVTSIAHVFPLDEFMPPYHKSSRTYVADKIRKALNESWEHVQLLSKEHLIPEHSNN